MTFYYFKGILYSIKKIGGCESEGRQTYKTDKCLTGGSRIYRGFYIILLDNFMGPTLEERKGEEGKKKTELQLCSAPFTQPLLFPPCDLPQLGLFYADLPGERMGTAAGLCCRTEGEKRGTEVREQRRGKGGQCL